MPDVRTLSDLVDAIDHERAWRRKEMHDVWSHIYLVRNTIRVNAFIRCGVTVLYAHWEGFVKTVGDAYVRHVAEQRLRNDDLSKYFAAMCARKLLRDAGESDLTDRHLAVADFFLTKGAERSVVPFRTAINTHANLNSDVLREIVAGLGLDYSPYATKEKLLDERLLKSRNAIAHGEYLVIDVQAFEDMYSEVFALIQLFGNQISNAARLGEYRRVPVVIDPH